MSEQTTFRVGDRVRAKNPNWELHFDCGNDFGILTHTDVGIVKGQSHLGDDFIEVAFCDGWVCEDFSEDELELVEPYDPKTAFLSDLKELLEKYNAGIEYHMGGDDKSDYSEYYAITIGGDRLTYDNCEGASLTSDNIMDYDKE